MPLEWHRNSRMRSRSRSTDGSACCAGSGCRRRQLLELVFALWIRAGMGTPSGTCAPGWRDTTVSGEYAGRGCPRVGKVLAARLCIDIVSANRQIC